MVESQRHPKPNICMIGIRTKIRKLLAQQKQNSPLAAHNSRWIGPLNERSPEGHQAFRQNQAGVIWPEPDRCHCHSTNLDDAPNLDCGLLLAPDIPFNISLSSLSLAYMFGAQKVVFCWTKIAAGFADASLEQAMCSFPLRWSLFEQAPLKHSKLAMNVKTRNASKYLRSSQLKLSRGSEGVKSRPN